MIRFAQKIAVLLIFGVLVAAFGPRGAEAREVQIIMALDVSGSMKVTDPLSLLPKSARIMMELLDEKDRLGVLTFEDVTLNRLACAPLNPAQKRQGFRELTRLQPRGLYTDLHAVLAAGLKCFGPPGGKRALLLISDGQMDINPLKGNSKAFVERVHLEIVPAYKKAGIPIYTVAFTASSDQALLKALAEQTGGRFLLIPRAQEIHQAFLRFYEELKGPQTAPLVGNNFVIDPQVREAILVATRSRQGRPVMLETPQKQRLGPASKAVRWFAAPTFDMVTIPQPEPGKWTVSGHKEGDGKIILMTDLRLECPHLPQEAGVDEALMAGALLKNKGQTVSAREVLEQTVFTASLMAEGGQPVQLTLGPPPVEQTGLWPPGARAAKFPTFSAPGVWHLKIRALGKTFQRERNIFIKVSTPWYKAQPLTGEGPAQVEFLPNPDRKAARLAGWVNLSSPKGGVAGKFVHPPPGSIFFFALPPELSGSYLLNLDFNGVTASGRPLVLQPPPLKLNLTPPAAVAAGGLKSIAAAAAAKGSKSAAVNSGLGPKSAAAASSPPAAGTGSRNRKWLWLGVMVLVGVIIILATIAYVFQPPALRFLVIGSSRGVDEEDLSPDQLNLMLKAQVESLQKEKGKLMADAGEMRQQIEKLTAAKEELEASLGQPSREYQQKSKVIKELEQRLEEAEKEAKSVQEEYMALYARSQNEKTTLKKS